MITLGRIAAVDPVRLIAIFVLGVFASWFMPRLRIGGSRHGQTLTDFTIIFGLTLLPGPWLILTIALATLIGKKLARFPTTRIVINTAKDVITVFVAAIAGWLCELGSPFETTSSTFGRIVIVALIALATDEAISVPGIALANGQRARDVWAAYAPFRLVMAVVRMGCGIAAGYLVNPDPRMALALPVLAIALHLAYANRLQQRIDRLAWARLSQLVDAVGTGEPQTVRLAAVHGTAELFACRRGRPCPTYSVQHRRDAPRRLPRHHVRRPGGVGARATRGRDRRPARTDGSPVNRAAASRRRLGRGAAATVPFADRIH